MTVKQLIARLKEVPPDSEVVIAGGEAVYSYDTEFDVSVYPNYNPAVTELMATGSGERGIQQALDAKAWRKP